MSNPLPHLPSSIVKLVEEASPVHIIANTRHLLTDPDMVWIVGPAGGDIFAWEYDQEEFIPYFLQEAFPGDLIFGINATQTFFFIASQSTTLYKIPLTALKASLHDKEARVWIADKLEKWAGKLLNLFAASSPPATVLEFPLSGSCDLEAGQKAGLQLLLDPDRKHRLAWINCERGEVEFAGIPDLHLTGDSPLLYPLTFFLWIEGVTEARIESYPTLTALDMPQLWEGLFDLHRKLFTFFEIKKKQDIQNAKEKYAKKQILEKTSDNESILTLGLLLEEQLAYVPLQEGDALFKACDQIGQILKVKMISPSHPQPTVDQQVQEIATLSGLYQRRIALKHGWWQTADYPILGFYGDNKKPVALINVSRTEFEFQDPESMERKKVTASNASAFDQAAFVFHPPLMGDRISFLGLLKFSYKEAFKENYTLLILAILSGLVNLYLPFAMKTLFDSLTATANITLLVQLTLGLVMASISLWIFAISKNFAVQRFNGISHNKLQMGLWGRILNFPTSFFRKKTAGELMNQVQSLTAIQATINQHMIVSVFAGIYAFFYMIQMITFSPLLTLAAVIGFIVPLLIYSACAGFQIRLFKRIIDISGTIQGFIIQLISGLSKIRVAGAESRFFKIWSLMFAEKKRLYLKFQKLQTITQLTHSLFPLAATVVIYTGAILLFKKQSLTTVENLSTGQFVGFATAFGLFVSSALDVLSTLFAGLQIRPLWQSAKTLIEQPLEKSLGKGRALPLKGKVVLDHISYRYTPEEDLTLKDILIQALPGEMVAIIGPSGAGKSTLVRLLLGFETPESGGIYYDDKNLDDFDPRSVRTQIGTVLQNAALISGSLYENIVGSGTYSNEAIERAIHFSGFAEDLKRLPMGLNTMVPMGGGSFSGGQKQRLMLARALVASPKILILDEATSALDNSTQEIVTTHLDRLRITRIVIAHRLSTVKNADRIYVLEKGQVVQFGTFKELAQQEGLFLSMLKRQTL